MLKQSFSMLLAVAALSCSALTADDWKLELEAVACRKIRVDGELYYYFVYKLTNPGKQPRRARLGIFCLIDRVRDGVSVKAVAAFKQFRQHQLPKWPRQDPTKEFDNSKAVFGLKRYYDMPYAAALPRIRRKHARPVKHTARLGTLAPGATVRGVALFKGVDRQMDYLGIMVKGLRNRIVVRGEQRFIEDRVRLFKYHSPGDAANVFENKIHWKGVEWVVLKRKKLRKP